MTDEQRDNVIVILECNTEELAGLPDGCGIQAVVNVRNLLDYFPTLPYLVEGLFYFQLVLKIT